MSACRHLPRDYASECAVVDVDDAVPRDGCWVHVQPAPRRAPFSACVRWQVTASSAAQPRAPRPPHTRLSWRATCTLCVRVRACVQSGARPPRSRDVCWLARHALRDKSGHGAVGRVRGSSEAKRIRRAACGGLPMPKAQEAACRTSAPTAD